MKPEELAQVRSEAGLTQSQFAAILNRATGRRYRPSDVSAWERGVRGVPGTIATAVESLRASAPFDAQANGGEATAPADAVRGERPPDAPPLLPDGQQPFVPTTGPLKTACVEMFLGIGGGLEVYAQFFNSPVVGYDGQIIRADAEALGTAYAKLAEQNEWVKRMLLSLTTGGAWVEVVMVTLTTGGKLASNHKQYAEHVQRQRLAAVPATDGHAADAAA